VGPPEVAMRLAVIPKPVRVFFLEGNDWVFFFFL